MANTTPWEYTDDRKFACMIEISPTATQTGAIRWFYTFRTHGLVDKSFTSKVSFELFVNEDHAIEEAMRIKRRFLGDYNNAMDLFEQDAPPEPITVEFLWKFLNCANESIRIDMFPWGHVAKLDAGTISIHSKNEDGSVGNPWYVGDEQVAKAVRTFEGIKLYDQQGFPMVWQYESLTDLASNLESTDCF